MSREPSAAGEAYPLKTLFWETTLSCNAHCRFCGSRCGETPAREDELTTDEILRAFRGIAEAYDARSIMINVTGGEPLLRKDLFSVMTECVKMDFSWGMVTNGMLLTRQTAEKLKKAQMKTISISLDGLEKTHEVLRGVKGSFAKVIAGIRILREMNFLEHLQVTTVVTKQNLSQLEELYQYLKPLGLNSWRAAVVDPIGRAADARN